MKVQPIKTDEIRVLVAETGNSLRSFSRKIDISQSYLSQILNGNRNPSPTIAFKIAKGLGVDIKDIFFITVDNKRYI